MVSYHRIFSRFLLLQFHMSRELETCFVAKLEDFFKNSTSCICRRCPFASFTPVARSVSTSVYMLPCILDLVPFISSPNLWNNMQLVLLLLQAIDSTWRNCQMICSFFLLWMVWWLLVVQDLLVVEASRSHSTRRITPLDGWSIRRRNFYLTTHPTLSRDEHGWPRWDSNPQSQQAIRRRPPP
jgi:hypothetical protein